MHKYNNCVIILRGDIMPISEARKRANRKYNEKAYDRIALTVKKGEKDRLKAHAEQQGETLNGFINRAIDEAVKRDLNNQE